LELFVEGEIYGILEILQAFDLYMIAIAEVNEVRWFLCVVFYGGQELEFFGIADDIDDGNLSIFEGGVENIGDGFLTFDGVPDNVDVVVSAVDISDGLEASIFVVSRFGDMFKFIDASMVFCNLPSVFVDGEEVIGANAFCGMFSFDNDNGDGNGDDNSVSGGELWSRKKPGELILKEQLPPPV
jgi:hypothetical protein